MKVIPSIALLVVVVMLFSSVAQGYTGPKISFQPDSQVVQVWFTASPQLTILYPPTYLFSVEAKTSSGFWITNLHWDFGDGSTLDIPFSSQSQVSDSRAHRYANQANYIITVTANDNEGNTGTATVILYAQITSSSTTTALSITPTVSITNHQSPAIVLVGSNATVTLSVTYYGVHQGDAVDVIITDTNGNLANGSVYSSPDPCLRSTGYTNSAVCKIMSPSSPSASEALTFNLRFDSAGTYSLIAGAFVYSRGQLFNQAQGIWRFSLVASTSGAFSLTTIVVAGQGGVSPACSSGCSESVGSPISVQATPSANWQFSGWNITGASCSGGSTSNPCSFAMPSNDITVSATFTQIITATTTVSITSLQSPSNELVGSNAIVTLAVAYNGVYNGDFIVVGIMVTNGDPGQFATGSSYSLPDSCVRQQQYLDQAECMLQPSSPSGSETLTFSLQFNSPGNYSLHAGAFVFTAIQLGISEKARYIQDFSIMVQNTPPPPNPDFTVIVAPNSLNMSSCNSPQITTVTIQSLNNFNRPVTLMGNSPTGITVSFLPNIVTPTKNGTITSQATITVSSSMPLGKYIIQINGTSVNQLTHSALLTIAVTGCIPGFSFESILAGIALGVISLACAKRRRLRMST